MDASEWDARYRQARGADGDPSARLWSAQPPAIVRDTVTPWTPGRALDLATGDGRTAIWLAGQGWSVTAVDFSAEAIDQARDHARDAGVDVDWQVGDAMTWAPAQAAETAEPDEPSGQYDLVTILYLHLPEASLRAVLERAARWLAPGGHLLVLGHDRANPQTGAPGPANPAILYTPELLRAGLDPSRILRCETIRRDLATDPESPADGVGFALDTILIASA